MDEEEKNYCCLALLLLRVGNTCLRLYFKTQWDAAGKYRPWTDCAQNGADLLRMFKPLPYEKNTVKSGDSTQWDLNLLVNVLLHSRPSFVKAANLVAALHTIKGERNMLCHCPWPRAKVSDFQKSWSNVCNALSLFGATELDIDQVKQDVQKPWMELLPMIKHFKNQDVAIVQELDMINTKLERLQEGHEKILEELSSIKLEQRKTLESHTKGFRQSDINITNYNTTVSEYGRAAIGQNSSLTIVESCQPAEKNLSLRAEECTEKLKSSTKEQTKSDFLLTSEEEEKKIRTDDIFTNVTI